MNLTDQQQNELRAAWIFQRQADAYQRLASEHVRKARELDVPLLAVARALGVSRSRIRVLAREHQQ